MSTKTLMNIIAFVILIIGIIIGVIETYLFDSIIIEVIAAVVMIFAALMLIKVNILGIEDE